MKNRNITLSFIHILIVLLIALFLLPDYSLSYSTGDIGHGGFSDKAIQLKKTKDPKLNKELTEHEAAINKATSAEDSPFWKTRHQSLHFNCNVVCKVSSRRYWNSASQPLQSFSVHLPSK